MDANLARNLEKWFACYSSVWREGMGGAPYAARRDGVSQDYYEEIVNEDCCYWRLKPVPDDADVRWLERELGFALHQTVTDYFSTYYFAELLGTISLVKVQMDHVLPGLTEAEWLPRLRASFSCLLPVGLEPDSGNEVVVDNGSGEVLLYDQETERRTHLASSLSALIGGLTL